MSVPVSIRTKNPGAMWPNALATQFGSTSFEQLKDGQGNKAAIFPTFEQGGAAQFALWAKKYSGLKLSQAIYMWSGHNSSPAYTAFLLKNVPGITESTVLSPEFFKSAMGRKFMAAQAQWEAGQPYPMTDEQWAKAQALAFGQPLPAPDIPAPKPQPAPQPAPQERVSIFWGVLSALFKFIMSIIIKRKDK